MVTFTNHSNMVSFDAKTNTSTLKHIYRVQREVEFQNRPTSFWSDITVMYNTIVSEMKVNGCVIVENSELPNIVFSESGVCNGGYLFVGTKYVGLFYNASMEDIVIVKQTTKTTMKFPFSNMSPTAYLSTNAARTLNATPTGFCVTDDGVFESFYSDVVSPTMPKFTYALYSGTSMVALYGCRTGDIGIDYVPSESGIRAYLLSRMRSSIASVQYEPEEGIILGPARSRVGEFISNIRAGLPVVDVSWCRRYSRPKERRLSAHGQLTLTKFIDEVNYEGATTLLFIPEKNQRSGFGIEAYVNDPCAENAQWCLAYGPDIERIIQDYYDQHQRLLSELLTKCDEQICAVFNDIQGIIRNGMARCHVPTSVTIDEKVFTSADFKVNIDSAFPVPQPVCETYLTKSQTASDACILLNPVGNFIKIGEGGDVPKVDPLKVDQYYEACANFSEKIVVSAIKKGLPFYNGGWSPSGFAASGLTLPNGGIDSWSYKKNSCSDTEYDLWGRYYPERGNAIMTKQLGSAAGLAAFLEAGPGYDEHGMYVSDFNKVQRTFKIRNVSLTKLTGSSFSGVISFKLNLFPVSHVLTTDVMCAINGKNVLQSYLDNIIGKGKCDVQISSYANHPSEIKGSSHSYNPVSPGKVTVYPSVSNSGDFRCLRYTKDPIYTVFFKNVDLDTTDLFDFEYTTTPFDQSRIDNSIVQLYENASKNANKLSAEMLYNSVKTLGDIENYNYIGKCGSSILLLQQLQQLTDFAMDDEVASNLAISYSDLANTVVPGTNEYVYDDVQRNKMNVISTTLLGLKRANPRVWYLSDGVISTTGGVIDTNLMGLYCNL